VTVSIRNGFTLRDRSVGGSVSEAVRELTPPFPQGRRRVVILVHGYNNTQDAARRSYNAFTDDLTTLSPAAGSLLADIGGLYWPGDVALGPLSFISYPTEIAPALESARKLATYLRMLAGPGGTPTEIFFVCHSLGNRVLLEVLDLLAADPPWLVQVATVVLMAAAVPVDMVGARGALRPGATLPGKTLVLYSRDDNVLHWAFPLGEAAAGEGLFPTAIGRFGQPPGVWTERRELAGDDHSDYWGDRRAAVLVAGALGVPVPRTIEAQVLAPRKLPGPTPLAPREIATRDLQS
jgi:hypothetical protein